MHTLRYFHGTHLFQIPHTPDWRCPYPGGLWVHDQNLSCPGFPELVKHLADYGYKPRRTRGMAQCDFTMTNGSIEDHSDYGNGLVAICLAHVEDPDPANNEYNYDAQLLMRTGAASLNVGSVVVFNSSRNHAWLSGFKCVLASVFVSKVRPAQFRNTATN